MKRQAATRRNFINAVIAGTPGVTTAFAQSLVQHRNICATGESYLWQRGARGIVRGDGLVTFDIRGRKNFVFTESRVLQFSVDFFNAFNHPNFGLPGGIGAPGFGVVGSANPGRTSQAGLGVAY